MKRVDTWECVIAVARVASSKATKGHHHLSSYRIAAALDKLARLARTLHRYYEWQCNGDTDENTCHACKGRRDGPHTYNNCAQAKIETLQRRAEKIGADIGIFVENQTDPRGPAIIMYANDEDAAADGPRALGSFT